MDSRVRGACATTLFLMLLLAVPLAQAAPSTAGARSLEGRAEAAATAFGADTLVRIHATDTGAGAALSDGRATSWRFTYLTDQDHARGREVVDATVKASGTTKVIRQAYTAGVRDIPVSYTIDSDEALAAIRATAGWDKAVSSASSVDYDLLSWKGQSIWVASVAKGSDRTFFGVDAETGRVVSGDTARHAWRGFVDAEAGTLTHLMAGEDHWDGLFRLASGEHDAVRVRMRVSFLGLPRAPTERVDVSLITPDQRTITFDEGEIRPGEGSEWLVTSYVPPLAGQWTVRVQAEKAALQDFRLDFCGSGIVAEDLATANSQRDNPACSGLLHG